VARFDLLVLGGGGILGEAWMTALLAGLSEADGFDPLACEGYVGTSAGSIVAAALAAGIEPRRRLGDLPEQPPVAEPEDAAAGGAGAGPLERVLGLGRSVAAPFAAVGLRTSALGGALARRTVLGLVPRGQRSLGQLGARLEGAGARFDGRLRIAAVDLSSGRRVMFGAPGAPRAPVGAAVEASCAIPGVFRPVEIDGRDYVDGGAWSPTNMDASSAGRGARVLCLNPTGSLRSPLPGPLGAFGLFSRTLAATEALALERRGASVTLVAPDAGSMEAIGANLMDPRPRKRVIAAGLAQGRALAG
jgi:NTE family protein